MRHLDIPRFSRNNKVLPSPTSTTSSFTPNMFGIDESDADSSASMTSIGGLVSPSGISRYHSEPISLAEVVSPSFHGSVRSPSGSGCAGSTFIRRASMFHERFDLLELYPRDPLRQTIYQGKSFSKPSMSMASEYRQKRLIPENSVFRITYIFRRMIGNRQDRK